MGLLRGREEALAGPPPQERIAWPPWTGLALGRGENCQHAPGVGGTAGRKLNFSIDQPRTFRDTHVGAEQNFKKTPSHALNHHRHVPVLCCWCCFFLLVRASFELCDRSFTYATLPSCGFLYNCDLGFGICPALCLFIGFLFHLILV